MTTWLHGNYLDLWVHGKALYIAVQGLKVPAHCAGLPGHRQCQHLLGISHWQTPGCCSSPSGGVPCTCRRSVAPAHQTRAGSCRGQELTQKLRTSYKGKDRRVQRVQCLVPGIIVPDKSGISNTPNQQQTGCLVQLALIHWAHCDLTGCCMLPPQQS
jgi:hypothetical protein